MSGGLSAELARIRAYTCEHPELLACHHFLFDFRIAAFERARFVVLGLNPGETAGDWAVAPAPAEESSEADYRGGVHSPLRARWYRTCVRLMGTDRFSLTELCFWSAPSLQALRVRLGPSWRAHLEFCRELNERLLAFHQPDAVIAPGLSTANEAARLYGLTRVGELRAANGHLLVARYERDGTPWLFTKHWTGAFGFSEAQKQAIAEELQALPHRSAFR